MSKPLFWYLYDTVQERAITSDELTDLVPAPMTKDFAQMYSDWLGEDFEARPMIDTEPEPPPERPLVYASPVGTEEQRDDGIVWPGHWVDVTGYLKWYRPKTRWAWHTGADLNLNEPVFDADAHAPFCSIADGMIYAIRQYSGWDWVICIEHADCLSRYAHCENLQLDEGEHVKLGDHLADIGNAGGYYPYHLHFDIAKKDARMRQYPGDWPGADKARVERDYYDPKQFLIDYRYGA